MELVTVKHAGAIIQLPHDVIVRNWMDSISTPRMAANESKDIPHLGEYWHGQGGIYAARMRGNKDQPDRHLIIPVTDVLNIKAQWGCHGKEIAGADKDLYGMPNTVAMAEAGSDIAKQILSMEVEGHCDFYLGARHEYRACYLNVPELFQPEWYWTSTQSSADFAFSQDFDGGYQDSDVKYLELRVRPVRSFVI
jgi:hypothetical protein